MLLPVALAGGCATASATHTRLRESAPIVRRYQEMRDDLAARDAAAGGVAPEGGCPVCQW